ncbi:MAG: class I SAM-dependent methyltransferase [Planctomycetota bacterium]|nr:class I SAM-dependent methyltransferase [Planctomycetota bacterium]
MSADLYSSIAHRGMAFMNPMGERSISALVEIVSLQKGANIVDFGAGTCELVVRLAERYAVFGECVELSPEIASRARERVAARVPGGGVRVHEGDAGHFKASVPAASFDMAVCIGSTHALGGFAHAVDTLARLTRQGGWVVLGEGYWKRPPLTAYLEGTGIDEGEFVRLHELLRFVSDRGLTPAWLHTASEQDWDDYEWAHHRNIEAWVRENPNSPDAPALLRRSRNWRRWYMEAGRDTLGFALMAFRRH